MTEATVGQDQVLGQVQTETVSSVSDAVNVIILPRTVQT